MRKQAELKVFELERMIRTILEDNQRLERHVQEWKLVAEQCKERKTELDKVVRKILVCGKEIEPKPDT